MTKLPSLTGKQLIHALTKAGFLVIRVRGSHHFLRHPDGKTTLEPVHPGETVGPGLLAKILRDCEINRQKLRNFL